jgi:hypothetical protein
VKEEDKGLQSLDQERYINKKNVGRYEMEWLDVEKRNEERAEIISP